MSLPKLDFRVLCSSSVEVSESSINELKKPLLNRKDGIFLNIVFIRKIFI